MRDHDIYQLHIPGIFPAAHLEYARRQGIAPEPLLRAAGLPPSVEKLAEAGLSYAAVERLMGPEGLQGLCPDEALGFRTGREVPVTALGHLGYAMMCSATVGDALVLALRYWDLAGRTLQMEVREEGDDCVLAFVLEVPATGMLRRWMLEAGLTSIWCGFTAMVPALGGVMEVTFDLPAPAHADEMRALLGKLRHDAPASTLRFPKHFLEHALPLHSASGLRQAEALCEAQLRLWQQPETMAIRVRRCLGLAAGGYPVLEEVAQRLHVSPRTLRRRLAEEGSGFAGLLEEVRRQDAMRLLEDRRLSVAEVARRLGYEEPANFTRAFRQWTGRTPSEWRESSSV